jgi:hypothetical protein
VKIVIFGVHIDPLLATRATVQFADYSNIHTDNDSWVPVRALWHIPC